MDRKRFFRIEIVALVISTGWFSAATAGAQPMVDPPPIDYTESFGRQICEPGYDEQTDLSGDQIVNLLDFNILRGSADTIIYSSVSIC